MKRNHGWIGVQRQRQHIAKRPAFPTLLTDRLRLRMLRSRDLAFLASLDANPDVMRYIHAGVLTREEALFFAQCQVERAPLAVNLHKWLVESNVDKRPLGWVEISRFRQARYRTDGSDDLNLGFEFSPEFWGQGYATESNTAVIDHVFEKLRVDRIVAYAQRANARSLRLLERLGFFIDGECQDDAMNLCTFLVLTEQA